MGASTQVNEYTRISWSHLMVLMVRMNFVAINVGAQKKTPFPICLRKVFHYLGSLLLLSLAACVQSPVAEPARPEQPGPVSISTATVDHLQNPAEVPYREDNPCPRLDGQLYQLTQSADPISGAKNLGLVYKDGKVQVLFALVDAHVSFLTAFDVELGTQLGNQVQAFVAIERLCELSNHPSVLAIQPPPRAIFP